MNAKGEITIAKIIQKIVSKELSTPVSCKVDAQYDQDKDFYKCDMLYRIPDSDTDVAVSIDSTKYEWTFVIEPNNNNKIYSIFKDVLMYLNNAGKDNCGLIPIDFNPVINIKSLKYTVANKVTVNINNLYNFRKLL